MKPADILIACFWTLALAGIFACAPVNAQNRNYMFVSRVVNDSSDVGIRDCHIINKTRRTGTVSNVWGDFKITAEVNDSISFSAIGYDKLTILLADSMFNSAYIVRLKPAAYELDEIAVRPLSFNIAAISKREIYVKPLPNQGGIYIPNEISPVTFLYDRFSREGKQKRHYKKIVDGTADFMIIGEKFNGEIVSRLTGLKDDELVKFMSFCNFSKDFLLNCSPETIKKAIRKKYAEYAGSNKNVEERQP